VAFAAAFVAFVAAFATIALPIAAVNTLTTLLLSQLPIVARMPLDSGLGDLYGSKL
jgi:hypothetical protein